MHTGQNFQFVHYGRLVFHKGTFLAIEALKAVDDRITLDIIGKGPELDKWRALWLNCGLKVECDFWAGLKVIMKCFGRSGNIGEWSCLPWKMRTGSSFKKRWR